MRKIDVSVILPAYNTDNFLKTTLDSLVNQEFKRMEIVAVNDGSTDRTLDVLKAYRKEHPELINIVDIKHSGAGGARNAGIDNANPDSEYIYCMDADDIMNSRCIGDLFSFAKASGLSYIRTAQRKRLSIAGFTLPGISYIDRVNIPTIGDKIIDTQRDKGEITGDFAVMGRLIRKSLFDGLKFPENNRWEDVALTPVLKIRAGKVAHIDVPYYTARLHLSSSGLAITHKRVNILDMYDTLNNLKANLRNDGVYEEYKEQYKDIYIKGMNMMLQFATVWLFSTSWVFMSSIEKRELITSIINLMTVEDKEWLESEQAHNGMSLKYFDPSLDISEEGAVKIIQKVNDKYNIH